MQKGKKRAAALGYPTVNISLDNSSVSGIYAARVLLDGREYLAAAFADQERKLLEAHLLDAAPNLYGKEISIELCKKIRESESFENDDTLRAAIAKDTKAVRNYFRARKVDSP